MIDKKQHEPDPPSPNPDDVSPYLKRPIRSIDEIERTRKDGGEAATPKRRP